jgi:phage FluMu protein Com
MASNDIRCLGCNKLLGKGIWTELEIKCPRCKLINNLKATSLNTGDINGIGLGTHHSLDGGKTAPR